MALVQEMGDGMPMWLSNYDRDTVAFYQKPNPQNTNSVINADLLFAPIIEGGFGGEIVGSGQRQDSSEEIAESLERQGIGAEPKEQISKYRNENGSYDIAPGCYVYSFIKN